MDTISDKVSLKIHVNFFVKLLSPSPTLPDFHNLSTLPFSLLSTIQTLLFLFPFHFQPVRCLPLPSPRPSHASVSPPFLLSPICPSPPLLSPFNPSFSIRSLSLYFLPCATLSVPIPFYTSPQPSFHGHPCTFWLRCTFQIPFYNCCRKACETIVAAVMFRSAAEDVLHEIVKRCPFSSLKKMTLTKFTCLIVEWRWLI